MASSDVQALIVATAQSLGVDSALALAVAAAESNYNQAAINPSSGAIGVFQLMPSTAAGLGVNPYNLNENVRGGIIYLSQMLQRYNGDIASALAAYNWGPGNVSKYGLSNAPAETRNYIAKIMGSLGIASGDPGTSPDPSASGDSGGDTSGDGSFFAQAASDPSWLPWAVAGVGVVAYLVAS